MAMTFRPDEDLAAELAQQADLEKISVQAVLTKAARQYVLRNRTRAALNLEIDKVLRDYPDTLRRLGEGPA